MRNKMKQYLGVSLFGLSLLCNGVSGAPSGGHLLTNHGEEGPLAIKNVWSPLAVTESSGLLGERLDLYRNVRMPWFLNSGWMLQGFENRPGPHTWMGEHFGKWLHTATLEYLRNPDPDLKEVMESRISEFYVIMHSLASTVDPNLTMKEQTRWLAEQARKRLPDRSFPARMYDWIKADYEENPDKDNWEKTRDEFARRYTERSTDGYNYGNTVDAGINYGASLISLFYGEGDFRRTIQIATLCGWDSDNPAATWGGLLGFMLGREGVEKQFPDKKLSGLYNISRTRINFPNRTPGQPGDDSFELMAERGIQIIDRVVIEEMGGSVDRDHGVWRIPGTGGKIEPAKH